MSLADGLRWWLRGIVTGDGDETEETIAASAELADMVQQVRRAAAIYVARNTK